MNKLVSKFNKKQFAVFVVTLICVCLFTATTVYAKRRCFNSDYKYMERR